jgi:hypothetical protein
MEISRILLLASLTLIGASCVDHDNVGTTSDDVTSSGAATQSACTVRTPTNWVVNGPTCTYPIRRSIPIELGESFRLDSLQGGGGYQDFYCDAGGLHLIEEVCEGVCELCL